MNGFGWVGHAGRNDKGDRIIEKMLRDEGYTPDQIAWFLISRGGRHVCDAYGDGQPKTQLHEQAMGWIRGLQKEENWPTNYLPQNVDLSIARKKVEELKQRALQADLWWGTHTGTLKEVLPFFGTYAKCVRGESWELVGLHSTHNGEESYSTKANMTGRLEIKLDTVPKNKKLFERKAYMQWQEMMPKHVTADYFTVRTQEETTLLTATIWIK
jgi:hypothetical protein